MFCPECGAPNEDDAAFCGNCGAVLDPDAVAEGAEPGEEHPEEAGSEPVSEPPAAELPAPKPPAPPRPTPPPPPPRAPSYSSSALPTSGLAVASLVLGIGGLTLLPLLGSILAVLFGYMARNDIRQRPGEVTGEGLATAGIVLGWIAIGLAVLGLIIGGAFTICGICGAFGSGSFQ
jgi:hypothetical protein